MTTIKQYRSISVKKEIDNNFKIIEKVFRKNYPEFDGIPLSKSKLILEMQKHYTKYYKEQDLLSY